MKNIINWKEILNWKDALVAYSISNLFFLRSWHELIFADPERAFYLKTTEPVSLGANLLNVFLLGTLILTVLLIYRRTKRKPLQKLIVFFFFLSIFFPLNSLRLLVTDISITNIVNFIGFYGLIFLILALITAILFLIIRRHESVLSFVSIIYIIFAPFLFLTVVQAVYGILTTSPPETSRVEKLDSNESKVENRVVWFIFDELDQRMTFEERPDGFKASELDSIKEKSFYATEAYAPGLETVISMPSFIIGEKIEKTKPKATDELKLISKESESFMWSEKENIFDKIKDMGGKSALTGVFLPYCRVIEDSLDLCSWQPFGTVEHKGELGLFKIMSHQFLSSLSSSPFNQRQHAIEVHKSIYNDAKKLVSDPSLKLVLVHWSIPHYPFIYDRKNEDFSNFNYDMNKGYYDNLALVDRTLKDMRKIMEEAGTWDNTHLIISSDHPWRMNLFPTYDEVYDKRIPFLVKTANKESATNKKLTHQRPFNTVLTHNLILELLEEDISTNRDISNWLEEKK